MLSFKFRRLVPDVMFKGKFDFEDFLSRKIFTLINFILDKSTGYVSGVVVPE